MFVNFCLLRVPHIAIPDSICAQRMFCRLCLLFQFVSWFGNPPFLYTLLLLLLLSMVAFLLISVPLIDVFYAILSGKYNNKCFLLRKSVTVSISVHFYLLFTSQNSLICLKMYNKMDCSDCSDSSGSVFTLYATGDCYNQQGWILAVFRVRELPDASSCLSPGWRCLFSTLHQLSCNLSWLDFGP